MLHGGGDYNVLLIVVEWWLLLLLLLLLCIVIVVVVVGIVIGECGERTLLGIGRGTGSSGDGMIGSDGGSCVGGLLNDDD